METEESAFCTPNMECQSEGPVTSFITMETEQSKPGFEIRSMIDVENIGFPEQPDVYTVRGLQNTYIGYQTVTEIVEFGTLSLVTVTDISYDSSKGTLYSVETPISEKYFQILFISIYRLPEWFFKNLHKNMRRLFCFEKRKHSKNVGCDKPDEYSFYELQINTIDIDVNLITGIAKDSRTENVMPFFLQIVWIYNRFYVYTNIDSDSGQSQECGLNRPQTDSLNLIKKRENVRLDVFDSAFSDVINIHRESKMREFQREFYQSGEKYSDSGYVMELSFVIAIPRLLEQTEDEQVLSEYLSVDESAMVYTYFMYAFNLDMNMPDIIDRSVAFGTVETGHSD